MKTRIIPLLILVQLLFVSSWKASGQEVTFQSLLNEMVNRDAIAEYPTVPYKTLQSSSYNRVSVSPDLPGWFEDSDGISCLRAETNGDRDEWVLMEAEGPGCIAKIWAVCFYYALQDTIGANVRFYLDGATQPTIEAKLFDLVKGRDFVKPPFADKSTRAGNLYLPIPYQKSCKITLDNKAFYYSISYRSYPEGTKVKTFTREEYNNSQEVLKEVAQKLNNTPAATEGDPLKTNALIAPGEKVEIALPHSSHAIKTMRIHLSSDEMPQALRSTVMQASFDGEETIWCPVGDFFNNGVKLAPYHMWERTVSPDGWMECRWVMPYKKNGTITLTNYGTKPVRVEMDTYVDKWKWTSHSMHFHASWRMDNPTPTLPIFDRNMVEVEGKGLYVGDQFTVLNPAEGWWGEGDEKIYIDEDIDKGFPSHFGTGTEDYYGWAGGVVPNPEDQFSKPFVANVLVGYPNSLGYNICSRTRVLDAIPFQGRFKFDMEASCGRRLPWFHLLYASASFWYAIPGAVSNRAPQPEMAKQKIMTVEELQKVNEKVKAALKQ
jgi:hypothetical protein